MNLIDLFIIILYLSLILFLGIKFGKTGNTKSYFLGDNSIHWVFILLSVIATETSSLTFLNIPGMSYSGDLSFLQVGLGFIIGRILVAIFLIPMYFKTGYSSIYELVSEKFGKNTQKTVSGIFLITRTLGDGIRLYATSIPIAIILRNFFGPIVSEAEVGILSLVLITVLTSVYTIYGGFKSVVVTDSLQFFIYVLGGIFSVVFLWNELGMGRAEIFSKLVSENKFNFYNGFKGNFFTSPYFFINGILGGIFISIGSHGVDQMFAQRILACKNSFQSQLTIILSGILVFFQFLLFLAIGLLLFLYFEGAKIHPDKVFSTFIITKIPSPILGFILAGILASAMSTLSSSINSMSMTIVYDWLNDTVKKNTTAYLSFIWSGVLFLSSLLPYYFSGAFGSGLVEIGLKISAFFFGPLIGLFFYIRFSKKKKLASARVTILALLFSLTSTILLNYSVKPAMAFLIPTGILIFLAIVGLFNRKS